MDMTVDTNEWWAGIGGQAIGPLSAADVRARWEAGEITPATLVWRAGFAEWRPAGEVAEIAACAPKPGAPTMWQPGAGSALAALAGAELAPLRTARPAAVPSGSARLDAFTGAVGTPRNEAIAPVAMAAPAGAAAATDPRPADPPPPASARRTAITTAVGTFAMGAAITVALLVVFRSDRGVPAPATDASAPATATAAAEQTAQASAAKASPKGAAPAAVPQAVAERAAPSPASAEDARPAVGREPLAGSEPVRASDPPARAGPKAARPVKERVAKEHPAAQRVARAEPRRAKTPQPPSAAETRRAPAAAASDPLAMAGTPATASAAPAKAPSRDPLADLVSDADLDHELGGAQPPKEPARTAPATTSRSGSQQQQTRSAGNGNTVYVPPAPGSDLPEGVTPVQINEAVKARMSSLRACIDEQRAADASAKGTLKLRWVIAGDGSVRDVRNLSSEYEGKPISRCISGVVKEIRFPTSRTSGQEVVFPFKF